MIPEQDLGTDRISMFSRHYSLDKDRKTCADVENASNNRVLAPVQRRSDSFLFAYTSGLRTERCNGR